MSSIGAEAGHSALLHTSAAGNGARTPTARVPMHAIASFGAANRRSGWRLRSQSKATRISRRNQNHIAERAEKHIRSENRGTESWGGLNHSDCGIAQS
jgi:hypothetical protein